MKRLLLFALGFVVFHCTHAQPLKKRLDSLTAFYAETLDFNGVVLVAQKGKVLLNKAYGYQDRDKNIVSNVEGIYLIGSITKQFTAEVVLMLAKEGKLSVTDKLSKYFPDYKYGDSITLHQMLTHTSGIFDYTRNPDWGAKLDTPMLDKEMFTYFWDKPLNFSPGTKMSYSNSNYKLLGMIIEKVTGKTYYRNVRERIFQPLGMNNSGFDITHLKHKNKTTGYFRVRNDSFIVAPVVDSTHTNAAGAIYSTAADLLKWHQALQSYKLLPKEWQDKAYVPVKNDYAYGCEVDSFAGKRLIHHSGHIHGYNSNLFRLPDEDVCIVVLTNLMKTGADPISYSVDIVKAMYDSSYAIQQVRREMPLAQEMKRQYEGVYLLKEDSSLQFTFKLKKEQLFLQVTGQGEVPLLPYAETRFFTKAVDAEIEFLKNDTGGYYMVLHQNGQHLEGIKAKANN